jgi:hypothetical protein
MYQEGQIILIISPTKRNPQRVIKALIYNIFPPNDGEPQWLQTKAETGRKINLYSDSPKIVGLAQAT